jgi:hypothetical protein
MVRNFNQSAVFGRANNQLSARPAPGRLGILDPAKPGVVLS